MDVTAALKCAGASHRGRVRGTNEDRLYSDPERGIFIVIDGVGGEAAGEVAAETALRVLRARLERQTGGLPERIREAIALANNEVYRLAQSREDWRGMACVLTLVVVAEGRAAIGHVGDSRLYKIAGGRIQKVTHDHSPVGEREDARELTEIEAMRHPRRNEVFRDVGSAVHAPDDEGFIELIEIPFEPESALLLCSDGLSDLVTAAQMLGVVRRHAGDRPGIVRQLVRLANEAGGKDNVTVLFIEGEAFASSWRGRPGGRPEDAFEQTHREGDGTPAAGAADGRGRLARLLWNRRALFIYGVVLGALLLFGLWRARF